MVRLGLAKIRLLARQLGPGLITGAADDDPSGIATYSQAGAQFGYGLLWTMPFSFPLMVAVQLISARIGRVTGRGLAGNMETVLPHAAVRALVLLLLLANVINIGADLAAMGDALELVSGASEHMGVVVFSVLCLLLQLYVPYDRYAQFLKLLTFSLLSYVAVLLIVNVDYGQVLRGLAVPTLSGWDATTMFVAVLGTTISPYLFFWQSAQEVEGIGTRPNDRPLRDAPIGARGEFKRIRIDTVAGMFTSNLIATAIMIATAATLHAQGVTIETSADAARALEPAAGRLAELVFAAGIIGTGLLGVPVLAGSAAYAVADHFGWRSGLSLKPRRAKGFYGVIMVAIAVGVVIDWMPISPIQALVGSAVVNGVVAVPLMIGLMLTARRTSVMGELRSSGAILLLGWLATFTMAAAAIAMALAMLPRSSGAL